MTKIKAKSKKL